MKTSILGACFALLILWGTSCLKSNIHKELSLAKETARPAPKSANVIKNGPSAESLADSRAPRAANVVKIGPAGKALPTASQALDKPISANYRGILRGLLMLVGVLLVLFLLSVMLFHSFGRRLGKRAFRAHAPTRHTDIWVSHKVPPEFFDP